MQSFFVSKLSPLTAFMMAVEYFMQRKLFDFIPDERFEVHS